VVEDDAAPAHGAVAARALLEAAADVLGAALRGEEIRAHELVATASDGALGNPAVLLDLLEQAFVAVKREQRRREASSACPCGACAAVPELALAFTLHHGRWGRSANGKRPRCTGPDVGLARVLSKAAAQAGDSVLLTPAAVERTGVDRLALVQLPGPPGLAQEEAASGCLALDLAPVWERAERRSRPLEPKDTMLSLETLLPVPELDAWEWMIAPDKRTLWEDVDTIASAPRGDRRPGVGTRFHSEQGKYVDEVYEVVEWKPFRRWTWDLYRRGVTVRSSVELAPVPGGTRVVSRFGVAPGTGPLRRVRARREIERKIASKREEALGRLRRILEVERREGGLATGVEEAGSGA
jgi:hypothetical protein